MALESGFFNSVNGDRKYNAEQISRYFDNILSSGVFKRITNCMLVSASSGMTLTVSPGAGLIDCHWFKARAAETVTIPTANAVLPRFDTVVARLDMSDSVRAISLAVVSGTPAENPVEPSPVRTETIHELVLALVYVPAGATSIAAENITDVRENEWYCGWVRSLVDTPVIKRYHYRYTAPTNDTTVAPIGIPDFVDGVDLLDVYVNGWRLAPGIEYTVNATTNSITLTDAIDAGTFVDIDVQRPSMAEDVPGSEELLSSLTQSVADANTSIAEERALRAADFAQVAPIGPGIFAFDGAIMLSGFVSSTSKRLYFSIPFNRPIDATGFTVRTMNMQVRQGGKYILGDANTWHDISADIFTATIAKNGMITITCEPTFVETPVNNAECAIHIEATAEIEFT